MVTRMRDSFRAVQSEPHRTSVVEAMKLTLQWVRHEAALQGVTIETHCEDPSLAAPIAHNHLIMVLCNLVSNAIQAMGSGGRISMYAEQPVNGDLQILVEDNGPGMAPEEIDRSLGILYTTKPEGLGLGLTVSQELIRSAGGKLTLQSEPGRGTRVTIRFPHRPSWL
jgi:two-component system NtrC family sensor kinase